MVSRKLSIRDEPNIRLRCSRFVQKLHVLPMKNVSMCRFKTSPCVPAPRGREIEDFFQYVSEPSNPPDELAQMFRKKIPCRRIIPPFFCKSAESGRFFFNYLHDSNSIIRMGSRAHGTSRPDHLWPELWKSVGKHAKRKEKQKWSDEKFHLEHARKLRGIYFIDPEDTEFKETIKNAHKKLETSVAPAMPVKLRKIVGVVHPTEK